VLGDYSPLEMLEMGVFGGNYFAAETNFHKYPQPLRNLALDNTNAYNVYSNYYEAKAGKNLKFWLERGWIYPEDPLGWFQWYCMYDTGRRHSIDSHQIRRRELYSKRWLTRARNLIIIDKPVSPVIKQGLLQWSINWEL
jgi:hypothetical protein